MLILDNKKNTFLITKCINEILQTYFLLILINIINSCSKKMQLNAIDLIKYYVGIFKYLNFIF